MPHGHSDGEGDTVAELRRSWDKKTLQGRTYLNQRSFELALQSFTAALHMCETNPRISYLKFRVLGEIGWVNRLAGRYDIATNYLEEALSLADSRRPPSMEHAFIVGELGMVYRLTDRYDEARNAFARQYALATGANTDENWTRVACRAIGNLGMANYQRALQLLEKNPDNPNLRHEIKDRIRHAISQLEERVRLADELWRDLPQSSHGAGRLRSHQSISWMCIGLSRLSLCYTTMAELDPKQKTTWTARALESSKDAVNQGQGNSVLPLSRFFYGRVLLFSARDTNDPDTKAQALEYFNPLGEIPTPAVVLCMEPSTEHRGYLRELVAAGGDLQTPDPSTGYTALDYAVFSGDHECIAIMLDGLRERLVSAGHSKAAANKMIRQQRKEARLRKGYREIFQEKFRPELVRQSQWIIEDEDNDQRMQNSALRRDTITNLRRIYAEELAKNPETCRMFDHLKVIKYMDFVEFGKLPRSSDGLAAPLETMVDMERGSQSEGEFVIFFSYRWINNDPSVDSPDDENRTQYRRMIDAVDAYLETDSSVSRDKLWIWMDFACVNQDNPSSGVSALPLIIAQCDVVITLQDDTYYDRAWCCVEAMMIQRLRSDYDIHGWFEQTLYTREGGTRWQLREAELGADLDMADKKLSYESDRPKVMFLERQAELLGVGDGS